MDELRGQIRIILSIKEGRSFGGKGSAAGQMFIEASLNGSILITDVVCLTEEPFYDAELIWESSKKSLRRLRTYGGNIKVQCFLVNESQMKQERIGHFVLSLREARVVPNGKSFEEIGESWWHWQKLNGPKPPYPELLCCLRLEGKPEMSDKVDSQPSLRAEWRSFPQNEPGASKLIVTDIEENPSSMPAPPAPAEEARKRNSPRKQNMNPKAMNPNFVTRLHSDKGVIQIGSDKTATDYFTLTIYMGQAMNLDLLLPENYAVKGPPENKRVFFHYSVMDLAANTANISLNDIQKPVSLNEKMVISLYSSLTNLQQYFSVCSKLFMKLMIGDQEIGVGELPMQSLVPTTNKEQFCGLQEDNSVMVEGSCFLRGSVAKEVATSSSGLQPYVQLRIKLKFEESGQTNDMQTGQTHLIRSNSYTILNAPNVQLQNAPDDDFFDDTLSEGARETDVTKKQNMTRNVQGHLQASGDVPQDMNTTELMKEVKAPLAQTHMSVSASEVRIPSTLVNKASLSEKSLHKSHMQAPETTCHTYALNIVVQSIVLQRLPVQHKCFLQFHHPNARIFCNSLQEVSIQEANHSISLQDMKCTLKIVSTPAEISSLLLAWPPKITVSDLTGGHIAFATLNMRPLLAGETKQSSYTTQLTDPKTSEDMGMLKVVMALEDGGPHHNPGEKVLQNFTSGMDPNPAVFDDRVAYKVVEELEDWKERQEILFKAELKKKEETHLAKLTEEWEQRRSDIEKNLNHNVEQCRMLAQSLIEATDELRLKALQNTEREKELNKFMEIVEEKHKIKIMELKGTAAKIEDDFHFKMTNLGREKDELTNRLIQIQRENTRLQKTIIAQEQVVEDLRKNFVSKDQVASMVEEMKAMDEKLEAALKSKSFFKEQWAMAVRQLHQLKTDGQQALQNQIRKNKEDLQNLGLQHVLAHELREDKDLLHRLRLQVSKLQGSQVNLNQPSPRYIPGISSMHSLSSTEKITSSTNSRQQNETDEEVRLKALMEERDLLMENGCSLEDPTLTKLNKEIRTLLLDSNKETAISK